MVHAPNVRVAPCIGVALGAALFALPSTAQAAPSEAGADVDAANDDDEAVAAQKPPRLSGPYLGLSLMGTVTGARVNRFGTDTPFAGGGGFLRFGQFVLPWFGLGLSVGGTGASPRTRAPAMSLSARAVCSSTSSSSPHPSASRASASAPASASVAERSPKKASRAAAATAVPLRRRHPLRLLPRRQRYRATKAGGFGIGPELGWLGFTPAAGRRPMSNTSTPASPWRFISVISSSRA